MSERPELDTSMEARGFDRWYWTMAELQPFARQLGVRAAGPKAQLTRRISARLSGGAEPAEHRKSRRNGSRMQEGVGCSPGFAFG